MELSGERDGRRHGSYPGVKDRLPGTRSRPGLAPTGGTQTKGLP